LFDVHHPHPSKACPVINTTKKISNIIKHYRGTLMPTLRIPTPLRPYADGQTEVAVQGANVGEALSDLVNQYPSLKKHLFNDGGDLRPFVNLFLGDEDVRHLQGVQTTLKEDDKLMIIPSIAGG
jgi:molybdopterin converting factor small subunit